MMLVPFDVIVKYPPKVPSSLTDWALSPLRREIQEYQKKEGYADWGPTHGGVAVGARRVFEFTFPKARFRNAIDFLKGRWKQYRYIGGGNISAHRLMDLADQANGKNYDFFELLDFKVSQLVGMRGFVAHLFGISEETVRVCSTGVAWLTSEAGIAYPQPINSIPPAYWTAHPSQWELWNWSRHFDHLHERKGT